MRTSFPSLAFAALTSCLLSSTGVSAQNSTDGPRDVPDLQTVMTRMQSQPRDTAAGPLPETSELSPDYVRVPNKPLTLGNITTEELLSEAYPLRTDEAALAYAGLAVDAAMKKRDLANQTWAPTLEWRCQPESRGGGEDDFFGPPAPIQVFDNLYYVGLAAVGSWLVVGDNGDLLLIDALYNEQDARERIVAGIASFGLDPARLRYVLMTHGHGDHYGGAPYLRERYGAQLAMGAEDWAMAASRGMPRASTDIEVQDGQQFTVGDITVTAVLTPGHTPANLSFIIPVRFRGEEHMAALWGGSGPPSDLGMKMVYRNSMTHFSNYTDQAGVDIDLSIHGDNNNFLPRLSQLTGLRDQDPHPFIVGRDAYVRYEAIYYNCASAQIADMISWGYRVKLGDQESVFPVRGAR